VRYLSPEWMAAARHAVAGIDRLRDAGTGIRLTIEHVARDAPAEAGTRGAPGPVDATIRWHVTIEGGRVELAEGPAPQPDLRFTADYATAAAITRGELSAQRAFAEGRLRVGGDLLLLVRHQRALATVDDALAGVRAETTYT
jgi:predicted lipid carrier protein YhbT